MRSTEEGWAGQLGGGGEEGEESVSRCLFVWGCTHCPPPPCWACGGFHRSGSQVVAMRSHLNKQSSPSVWTAGDPPGSEEDPGPHPPPPLPPLCWGWHSAGICRQPVGSSCPSLPNSLPFCLLSFHCTRWLLSVNITTLHARLSACQFDCLSTCSSVCQLISTKIFREWCQWKQPPPLAGVITDTR